MKGHVLDNIRALVPGASNYGHTAYDIKDLTQGGYSQPEQDTLVDRQRTQGNRIINSARNPDQQKANYAYYDWNLAKHNPRGNLNNRSFATTERFSRLADLLNNQVYFDPDLRSGTINPNTGSVVESSSGGASIRRWEPIETQEMRQMRANERMDERARGAQTDLQARIQEYPQEAQEMIDKQVVQLSDYILRMQDQFFNLWKSTYMNTEYRTTFEKYLEQRMMLFANEVKYGTSEAVQRFVLAQTPNIGTFVAKAIGLGVPPPDIALRAVDMVWKLIDADPSLTTQAEKLNAAQKMINVISLALGIEDLSLVQEAFRNSIGRAY